MFFGAKRVHLRVVGITRSLLKGIVLTPARFDMMRIIELHGEEGILQAKIRDLLGVSAATVSVMVRSLELLGYVRRSRFVRDARCTLVRITEVGIQQLGLAVDRLVDSGIADRIAEHGLTTVTLPEAAPHDLVVARQFLRRIRRNYSDPAPFEDPWTLRPILALVVDTFTPALLEREVELREELERDEDDD